MSRFPSRPVLAVLLAIPCILSPTAPVPAQEDRAAGLFTEARQLPIVSQSAVVRIDGADATVELTQVFANDGDAVAQADYRLHLPDEATVTGFGFWRGDRFLEAELREREAAREAHHAAAAAGKATGLLVARGRIHSFSVYPLEAGELQTVQTTLRLPVARERGRSHLRLPLDTFLGHAAIGSSVLVHLETPEPLRRAGVEGRPVTVLERTSRRMEMAFASDTAAEIWWAEEAPPLLTRAEAVPLDDGSFAVQLRVVLNDGGEARPLYRELIVLVDASASMRRRSEAVLEAVERILVQSPVPPRIVSVAETAVEVDATDRATLARLLLDGAAGFTTTWDDLIVTAKSLGCDTPATRCVAITDPQILGLSREREPPFEVLFLADADELAYFEELLRTTALVHQPDADPRGRLLARVDETILPVLEIVELDQSGGTLEIPGVPRTRIAQGGMLRLFGRSRSTEPVELGFTLAGRPAHRAVAVEILDPDTRQGRGVRRGLYQVLLDDWTREYRKSRDPELRQQIVDVSLREEIPTAFTSLHVSDEMAAALLPATATTAPLLRRFGTLLLLLGLAGAWVTRARR